MRHFLADDDLTSDEQREVLARALSGKADRFGDRPLQGPQSVAVIFDKPTLRTQVSFSAGISELGGFPLIVDGRLAQIGVRESVADVARVLGRQVQAIVWRTFAQTSIEEMSAIAGVPVINALTDDFHPCQSLADLLTIAEHTGGLASEGPALPGRRLTYVGDGANNMAHSYLLAGTLAGMHVRIAAPAGQHPREDILDRSRAIAAGSGGSAEVLTDPVAATTGADVLATDTWVSMGQEESADDRLDPLWPYQLNAEMLARAAPSAIVLHCLPAYRGKEITDEVLEGPQSRVWDEAENRLHVQKAILAWLLERR